MGRGGKSGGKRAPLRRSGGDQEGKANQQLFADSTDLVADSEEKVMELGRACERRKLKVNMKKLCTEI